MLKTLLFIARQPPPLVLLVMAEDLLTFLAGPSVTISGRLFRGTDARERILALPGVREAVAAIGELAAEISGVQ